MRLALITVLALFPLLVSVFLFHVSLSPHRSLWTPELHDQEEKKQKQKRQEKATQRVAENKTDYNGRKTLGSFWHLICLSGAEKGKKSCSVAATLQSDCTIYTSPATRKSIMGKLTVCLLSIPPLCPPPRQFTTHGLLHPATTDHRTQLSFMPKHRGWKCADSYRFSFLTLFTVCISFKHKPFNKFMTCDLDILVFFVIHLSHAGFKVEMMHARAPNRGEPTLGASGRQRNI